MIKQKGGCYPFAILNTDRSNLPGTYWWSILNIYLAFTEHDDHDIINKILYNTKKFNKDDDIATLITLTFSRENFEKLSKNKIWKLSPTAADLIHVTDEFAELSNVKKEVMLHFVDDQLQNVTLTHAEYFSFVSTKTFLTILKKVKS